MVFWYKMPSSAFSSFSVVLGPKVNPLIAWVVDVQVSGPTPGAVGVKPRTSV